MDFDSIDAKTAFKLGFATRCFEMGMSPEDVNAEIEKQASGRFGWVGPVAKRLAAGLGIGLPIAGGMLGGKLVDAASSSAGMMVGLGGLTGLLGGGALGYAKAKFDEEPLDEDEIKAKELENTYKAYAARMKSQNEYKKYLQAKAAL